MGVFWSPEEGVAVNRDQVAAISKTFEKLLPELVPEDATLYTV